MKPLEKFFRIALVIPVLWLGMAPVQALTPAGDTLKMPAISSSGYLSLEQARTLAREHNPELKMARLDQEISQADYRQTQAVFLPKIGVSYTALLTDNPLNAFGFKLQQQSISPADFDPAALNHPSATRDFSALAEIQQPLFHPDLYYQRKGARAMTEMYAFQRERSEQWVDFQVVQTYLQIQWSYRNREVLERALERARQMLRVAQNFLAQGLIQKSDELNVQVHVATLESHLSQAASAVENTSGALALLMGRAPEVFRVDSLVLDHTLAADIPAQVPASRADFLALDKALDASASMLRSARMNRLPKLSAFGNYQWNDRDFGGLDAESYLVGVRMSWDLFSGTRTRNDIASKQLQYRKLQEKKDLQLSQARLDLDKARRDLRDARLDVHRQELAVQQSSEALRILENRHREGLVSTNDLLTAQNQWSQQQLQLARSVFACNVQAAYIEFVTSTSHP